MGAKTRMMAIVDGDAAQVLASGPRLDRSETLAVAGQLFPSETLVPLQDTDLSRTYLPDDEIAVGCFPGVIIVAAREFGIDRPSRLLPRFLQFAGSRTVCLHAMHSAVDWFAYAVWENGTLQRSLSLSPDSGVMEDEGSRRPFEAPYWSGAHPATDPADGEDDYPLPFHPLELGEAALLDMFGYQLEGVVDPDSVQPEEIVLMRFKRKKAWWKRW